MSERWYRRLGIALALTVLAWVGSLVLLLSTGAFDCMGPCSTQDRLVQRLFAGLAVAGLVLAVAFAVASVVQIYSARKVS